MAPVVNLLGVPPWTELGSKPMLNSGFTNDPGNPASGGVEDVAIDPNNPAHIFVATINGGIWVTNNGNDPYDGVDDNGVNGVDDPLEQPNWFPLTDQFASLAMGGIAFSPLDATGNTVFAGSGSSSSLSSEGGLAIGVFRTTNGGATWNVFPLTPGPGEPQVRVVLPTTFDGDAITAGVQQVVLVGTTAGLFRSIDAGQTYTAISGTNGLANGAATDVIVDPNNASVYYAGVVNQGVFRSNDGGLNWAPVNTGITNIAGSTVIVLSAHPGGGTTVLHTLVSGPNPIAYTSNNGGGMWTALAALPAGFTSGFNGLYTGMASDQITHDPTNSAIVYVAKGYGGSPFVLRYNPAGMGSWVTIDTAAGGTQPHVDSRDLLFNGNTTLLYANDGGLYFIRNPQNAAANRWTSLHGRGANGLGPKEFTNVAWDSRFDVVYGGAQDNGTSVQNGTGDPIWTLFRGADGGDAAVDTVNAGAGRVFRYSSTQNFGLQRHTFDSATNQPVGAVGLVPAGGLAGFTNFFVPPYELNAVNPARLVTGGSGANPVYELLNAATAPNAAGATWVAVPIGAGFGNVNQTRGAPFRYGGRLGGVDNPEVLVVASGSGVFIRSTAGGTLTATPTAFPGGFIQDLVLDPNNWQHIFVTDGAGVWETTNAGTAWTNITNNLALVNNRLQSIDFVPTPTGGVVVVGGNLGVSRFLGGSWTRFGLNLPNALVSDLDYNAGDDVLIAGEFGRGAWSVDNASAELQNFGILQVCGDSDFANQDDTFLIRRNAANPLLLEVFENGVLAFTGPLALIQQINVFAAGGNDTLIVDSSNGLITVPNGIRYDGDHPCPDNDTAGIGGFDTLRLDQTGGPAIISDVLNVGATAGQGTSTIRDNAGGTQIVHFQYLEPIIDVVPAPSLVINGGLVGTLLNRSNAINYQVSDLFGVTWGEVTIDEFEPIHFTNKANLTIDAEAGSDEINLNNPNTPTSLTTITVIGGDPTASDTVIVNGTAGANTMTFTPSGVGAASITSTGQPTVNLDTVEAVIMNGQGGTDSLSIAGTAADDTATISPAIGSGTFRSTASPALDFQQYESFTVTGGGGGFDLLALLGTAGPDAVTSAAADITLNTIVTNVGAGIDRVDVDVLAGNDNVNLLAFTAVASNSIFGGLGDDSLLGSPGTDTIYGGAGNDTIVGAGGVDQEYGEGGNDRIGDDSIAGDGVADDPGNDIMFGGDGIDQFVWEPGDGSDVIQGGVDGADILRFFGTLAGAVVDNFLLTAAAAAPTHFNIQFNPAGGPIVDTHGVEQIIVTGFGGADTFTVGDLFTTEVGSVILDLGSADAAADAVTVNGRTVADNVDITSTSAGTARIQGLRYDVNITNTAAGVGGDTLTFLANEGNDDAKAIAPVEGSINIVLDGGQGNDFLSADATLLGGAGDDTLEGGAGNDSLDGGAGEDLLQGLGGLDTINGGADFDTVLIEGTSGNDIIDVFQSAAGTLAFTINGVSDTDTISTLEEARIEAKAGDDLIRVGVVDALVATPALSLRITVEGGPPSASDRLLIRDDGLGDLTILRHGTDGRSGTATVGPLAPIVWNDVERIDVTPINHITGGTGTDGAGRVVVFHNDPFEFNETLPNAGELARVGQSPTSPTIDPGGLVTPFPVDGDEDWYEFRPLFTSTYQVKILFDRVATLANGRAGLPGTGDLSLEIYDANGGLITTGVADVGGNNRTAVFGATPTVAQFARIYVRVRGASAVSINSYDFDNIPGNGTGNPGVTDVDNFGPQVTNVQIETALAFDLFNPKPAAAGGPTPLVTALRISFRDLPPRAPGFIYTALDPVTAGNVGNYRVIGDNAGNIPIFGVTVINNPPALGLVPTATVILNFDNPATAAIESLPDDRLTLIVEDDVMDPAENKLDGDSNAAQPLETPTFPSGDGEPGGDFVARFTVDTRPEIAAYCFGGVYVDLNGNFVFDPVNKNNDQVNADKVFVMGQTNDRIFAGDFTNGGPANGFDKFGVYGRAGGVFRFLLDTNDDGVTDLTIIPTLQIDGLPVAGDFAPGRPGAEIGVFNGTTWFLDTNGNNNLDAGDVQITDGLTGFPIVGDFDGNGQFDLATYQPGPNLFLFHLNPLGAPNVFASIAFGFSGRTERPVAADMDRDGVTDIGLFVVNGAGITPSDTGEWYFLVSGFRPRIAGTVVTLNHPFDPTPFGTDLYAQFGSKTALPVAGNFDPPIAGPGNSVQAEPELVTNSAGSTSLVVKGTVLNDTIAVMPTGDGQSVRVTINGLDLGRYPLDEINQIFIAAKGGNDTVVIDPSISLDAIVKGGPGHDVLHGGGGDNLLFGAAGNDVLHGGVGRNVLIGAGGADQLFGATGQDLLIGGRPAFGGKQAALNGVLAEWTSARDLATRIANLNGAGSGASFAARLNANWFLRGSGAGATVFDDGARDLLQANAGINWYFGRFDPAGPTTDFLVGALATDVKTKV